MSNTITVKKDDIPEFRINNEFGYVVGDKVNRVVVYGCTIISIDGDNVTLQRESKDEYSIRIDGKKSNGSERGNELIKSCENSVDSLFARLEKIMKDLD